MPKGVIGFYTILFKRLGIALLLFSISRIIFALFNPLTFKIDGVSTLVYGSRYDIVAIAIIHSLFFLLHLYPSEAFFLQSYQKLCKYLFHIINSIALLFNFIDCAWYPFTQKRSTFDIFQLLKTGDDAGNNIAAYIIDYWYILLLWIGSILLGIFLYNKIKVERRNYILPPVIKRIPAIIILIPLFVIAARGGLQYKPVSVQAAANMVSPSGIPLVLNSPFTLIKSMNADDISSKLYMSAQEADKIFNLHKSAAPSQAFTNENVIIIILESFSKEYIGFYNNGDGYTPFLDSLMSRSLVFTNAFANGKRSIEGIPAIATSLPSLTDEPFITSTRSANFVNSLASVLKPNHYTSAFFHGGNNGTMGFDSFSKLAGYDNYLGRKEYTGSANDYDGHWGIFDEPFYDFMNDKINSFKQPFLTTFFSLSSHHPYTIPSQYKNKFPKGNAEIHESIGYADHALKTFFEKASKQSWFNNTIFVITADHTGPAKKEAYKSRYGVYEIPIVFYRPGNPITGKDSAIAQQSDILPSVLDLLHYKGKYSAFGQSLFSPAETRAAINYANSSWQTIAGNYVMQFDGDNFTGVYNIKNDPLMQKNIKGNRSDSLKRYEMFTKAFLQQYNQALIHNSIIQH